MSKTVTIKASEIAIAFNLQDWIKNNDNLDACPYEDIYYDSQLTKKDLLGLREPSEYKGIHKVLPYTSIKVIEDLERRLFAIELTHKRYLAIEKTLEFFFQEAKNEKVQISYSEEEGVFTISSSLDKKEILKELREDIQSVGLHDFLRGAYAVGSENLHSRAPTDESLHDFYKEELEALEEELIYSEIVDELEDEESSLNKKTILEVVKSFSKLTDIQIISGIKEELELRKADKISKIDEVLGKLA